MRVQVRDGKSLLQFFCRESLAQVLAKGRHAIFAVAIMPVKIVGDEAIHSPLEAAASQTLQDLAQMRVVQTRAILAHPADAVGLAGDRLAEFVLLQQIKRINDRLWSEQLFIPLVTIKAEEAAR